MTLLYVRISTEEDNVNTDYEIDASRNGGVNHQFEAVVRKRKDRQHLHAGDCECCREYYQAVGPLPARLAPPLWKSPSPGSSPSSSMKHRSASPGPIEAHAEIQNHKQQISRHRHNWAPPSTPPDYWFALKFIAAIYLLTPYQAYRVSRYATGRKHQQESRGNDNCKEKAYGTRGEVKGVSSVVW